MAAGLHLHFTTSAPPNLYFLKAAAGVAKGSGEPGGRVAAKLELREIYEIAAIKGRDPGLSHLPLHSVCKMLIGSARSMGVTVEMGREQEQ